MEPTASGIAEKAERLEGARLSLMNRTMAAIMLLAGLAGCTDATGDQEEVSVDSTDPDDSPPASNQTSRPISKFADYRPAEFLHMGDCNGMIVVPSWPTMLVDARPPPEWNETLWPLTATPFEIHQCAHFSLGPLERSNVTFVIQTHDNRDTPDACAEGVGVKFHISEIIHAILVDDVEIAQYLASLGMPAEFGTASSSVQEYGQATVTTWTLTPSDEEASEISVMSSQDPDARASPILRRFWVNSVGGVSFIDMKHSVFYSGTSVKPVHGSLHEPFMGLGSTEYVADSGTQFWGSYVSGALLHFGDLHCKEPLSSL